MAVQGVQTEAGGRTATRAVRVTYTPDPWPGGRLRIGFVALATDHATEAEFARMLPHGEAEMYVSRVAVANPCTVANLGAMVDDLTRATSLILPGSPLHAVAFGCTSGTVVMGPEEVARRVWAVRPGVPVSTPITAAEAGFRALGVRSVAMLTPYIDEVNRTIRDYLEARGTRVAALDSFGLVDDLAMTAVPPRALRDAALEADCAEAEAMFICCTALRATGIIDELEQRLGKPVVTSNQALLWHTLRLAGWEKPLAGYGRLTDLPLP